MKSLVIFDLDGTLVNTIDDLGAAANHAMRIMGNPTHSMSSYPMMVGNGITKLIERAMPDDQRTPERIAEARGYFMEYYNEHLADATVPYPGIVQLVNDLTERGVNLAVASNKYQDAVVKIVKHFFPEANFKSICGQIEGVPVKPDPSIVFRVLSECPTPKEQVLYVGDSGLDIETARRACVDSVGVTWGFRPAQELRAAYADHIITDPLELLDFMA
jgi:phosphoglycolate phosphatase